MRFLPAGEQIAPPLRDEPPWELPAERGAAAPRTSTRCGCRWRCAATASPRPTCCSTGWPRELRARDEEIARLRGHHDTGSAAPVATGDFRRPAAPAPEPDPAPEADTDADPDAETGTRAEEDTHADVRADAPDGRA